MEAGSGWRCDGFISTRPSVPLPPRPGPPQPLHHLLPGPQPAVPALHLPGALQVCVHLLTCAVNTSVSETSGYYINESDSVLHRLTPRNCPLLTNQSLSESQPWFEMLVRIQEITRDLSGTRLLQDRFSGSVPP